MFWGTSVNLFTTCEVHSPHLMISWWRWETGDPIGFVTPNHDAQVVGSYRVDTCLFWLHNQRITPLHHNTFMLYLVL